MAWISSNARRRAAPGGPSPRRRAAMCIACASATPCSRRRRARLLRRRHPVVRRVDRRARSRAAASAVLPRRRPADEPGVGHEARHDLRGARAPRAGLPLEDRSVSRGQARSKGTLAGNLVLKGHGDPKITIEQWQRSWRELRAKGLARSTATWSLDRSYFKLPEHDPAAFDQEPLRPYNVGPDALLVNFKAVRFVFGRRPRATPSACAPSRRWPRSRVAAGRSSSTATAATGALRSRPVRELRQQARVLRFRAAIAASCGERDWYVALLDHPSYVHGMFTTYFRDKRRPFRRARGRGPAAAQREAVRARWSRRRCTTSCATSTSYPTTSWRGRSSSRSRRRSIRRPPRPRSPPTSSTSG